MPLGKAELNKQEPWNGRETKDPFHPVPTVKRIWRQMLKFEELL